MAERNQLDLFGLDLSRLAVRWRRGWVELLDYLSVRGALPAHPVTLLHADGGRSIVAVPGFVPVEGRAAKPAGDFYAVELPGEIVLERTLPATLSGDDLLAALRLEVESSSPFPAEDTAWGWRRPQPESGVVHLAITSRRFVEAHLAQLGAPGQPEVWAKAGGGYAVVHGFGESRREAAWRRRLRGIAVRASLVALLAAAMLVSPLVEKRRQVVDLIAYGGAVAENAAPAVAMREELSRLTQLQHTLGAGTESAPDVVALLDYVTVAIPDGAWLDIFEYHPGRLRLSGRADDAAALLQLLEAHPDFSNVRAPSPISREPSSNKERFVIELDLVK